MVDPLTALLVGITATAGTIGAYFAYLTGRRERERVPILVPADNPDDWGHDVYVVTVQYDAGRRQTLVLVDTDSDIDDHGDHADGPTPYRLKAYVEDTIDNATVTDVDHVQAYQVDDDVRIVTGQDD